VVAISSTCTHSDVSIFEVKPNPKQLIVDVIPRSKIEPSPCTAAKFVAKPDELVKRIPDWPQTVADRIEQGRFIASDKLIDVSWKTLDTHWEEFCVNHRTLEEDPGFQVTS
jgi:hypothetical protein